MRLGSFQQRRLHCPAGRIVHMHDAPVRMPALTRQMQLVAIGVERHTQRNQPVDGMGRALDHKFHRFGPVEPGACDGGVANMVLKGIACVQHSGNATLRPRR